MMEAAGTLTSGVAHALSFAFGMTWQILWALVLGFVLSGIVQAVVSKSEMSGLLPDDSFHSIAVACGLGVASSSCSYAAVALTRSVFRKGANFTAAMAFQFASTNLVIELGIILMCHDDHCNFVLFLFAHQFLLCEGFLSILTHHADERKSVVLRANGEGPQQCRGPSPFARSTQTPLRANRQTLPDS